MPKKSVIKTVARNIRATKSAHKKIKKAVSKRQRAVESEDSRVKSQRSYSLRDLPNVKGKTFNQIAANIRSHSDELNTLLKPGEMWAFELGSDENGWNKSWELFDSADLMADKLERYEAAQLFGSKNNKKGREWIEAIKIVKRGKPLKKDEDEESHYHLTVDKYRRTKDREVKTRKKKNANIVVSGAELAVKKGAKKVANKYDIIESLTNVVLKYEEQEKEMDKKLAEMQRQINKLTKATTSKSAKKPTKKVVKRATTKSAKRVPKKHGKKTATKKATPKPHTVKKVAPKKKASTKTRKNASKKAGHK